MAWWATNEHIRFTWPYPSSLGNPLRSRLGAVNVTLYQAPLRAVIADGIAAERVELNGDPRFKSRCFKAKVQSANTTEEAYRLESITNQLLLMSPSVHVRSTTT